MFLPTLTSTNVFPWLSQRRRKSFGVMPSRDPRYNNEKRAAGNHDARCLEKSCRRTEWIEDRIVLSAIRPSSNEAGLGADAAEWVPAPPEIWETTTMIKFQHAIINLMHTVMGIGGGSTGSLGRTYLDGGAQSIIPPVTIPNTSTSTGLKVAVPVNVLSPNRSASLNDPWDLDRRQQDRVLNSEAALFPRMRNPLASSPKLGPHDGSQCMVLVDQEVGENLVMTSLDGFTTLNKKHSRASR